MIRIILAAIVGFFAWSIIWVGSEKILSAIWPEWYGAHQVAFEAAVMSGNAFAADTTILVMNIVRGSLVTLLCGFLAALIARENRRSPLILGLLLVAFCLYIVAVTWNLVPVWYHILFTTLLIPMALWGGRMKKFA